jgi:5-methylcytosine-specific restriction endonuclease McrA
MPISPEQRALYPKDWKQISLRVRQRAANKCELCKAPNRKLVARGEGRDAGTYMLEHGAVFSEVDGTPLGVARGSEYVRSHLVRIVLTVSHTNQDPTDNRDENLRALCQKCHLHHDKAQHQENARRTRLARKAVGNLPGVE